MVISRTTPASHATYFIGGPLLGCVVSATILSYDTCWVLNECPPPYSVLVSVVFAALGHGCCCLCPVPSLPSANKLIAGTGHHQWSWRWRDCRLWSQHNNTFSNLHLDGISDAGSRMQITLGWLNSWGETWPGHWSPDCNFLKAIGDSTSVSCLVCSWGGSMLSIGDSRQESLLYNAGICQICLRSWISKILQSQFAILAPSYIKAPNLFIHFSFNISWNL